MRKTLSEQFAHIATGGAVERQLAFFNSCVLPSRQEAEKNWAAFQGDPEWQKVKAESEANGPLVNHIDHYFMDPTSYSALN